MDEERRTEVELGHRFLHGPSGRGGSPWPKVRAVEETKEWVPATESTDRLKKCSVQLEVQTGHLQCGVGGEEGPRSFCVCFQF